MAHQFNLNYAPHINLFSNSAGKDPIDQIKYMADLGFKAIEDIAFNGPHIPFDTSAMGIGMYSQEPKYLDKIGNTIEKLGMTMGSFAMVPHTWPPTSLYTSGKPENRDIVLKKCHKAVDVAKRINAKFVTIVLDCYDRTLPIDIQTANVLELLRPSCDIFEPHGITMVIEAGSDYHELFLRSSSQAYLICRAINRQSCKINFDMYHLYKNEGRLIHNMDLVWDEIGYFQISDEPGRCEPGTGEINYKNIFKHIYHKQKETGKNFILGMENFKSKEGIEGEKALLEAYLEADNFL